VFVITNTFVANVSEDIFIFRCCFQTVGAAKHIESLPILRLVLGTLRSLETDYNSPKDIRKMLTKSVGCQVERAQYVLVVVFIRY